MKPLAFFSWIFTLAGLLTSAVFHVEIDNGSGKAQVVVEEQLKAQVGSELNSLVLLNRTSALHKIFPTQQNPYFFFIELANFNNFIAQYDIQQKVIFNCNFGKALNIRSNLMFSEITRHIFIDDDYHLAKLS